MEVRCERYKDCMLSSKHITCDHYSIHEPLPRPYKEVLCTMVACNAELYVTAKCKPVVACEKCNSV